MTTVLLDTALYMPLAALLSYLIKRRYRCSGAACIAAFLLGATITVVFSATGLVPTNALPRDLRTTFITIARLIRFDAILPVYRATASTLGNLILLVPFALLTSLLFPEHRSLGRQLLLALALSVLIEVGQLLLKRPTDSVDIILNCMGAGLGYYLCWAMRKRWPDFCQKLEIRGTQCVLCAYVLSALVLLLFTGTIRMAIAI